MHITDKVLQYQHGAEWMIGRKVNVVEPYTEDGHSWAVCEIILNGSPKLFRFPIWVMDATSWYPHKEQESTTTEPIFTPTDTAYTPEKPESIPEHTKVQEMPETTPKTPENVSQGGAKPVMCASKTRSGRKCKNEAVEGSKYCRVHSRKVQK